MFYDQLLHKKTKLIKNNSDKTFNINDTYPYTLLSHKKDKLLEPFEKKIKGNKNIFDENVFINPIEMYYDPGYVSYKISLAANIDIEKLSTYTSESKLNLKLIKKNIILDYYLLYYPIEKYLYLVDENSRYSIIKGLVLMLNIQYMIQIYKENFTFAHLIFIKISDYNSYNYELNNRISNNIVRYNKYLHIIETDTELKVYKFNKPNGCIKKREKCEYSIDIHISIFDKFDDYVKFWFNAFNWFRFTKTALVCMKNDKKVNYYMLNVLEFNFPYIKFIISDKLWKSYIGYTKIYFPNDKKDYVYDQQFERLNIPGTYTDSLSGDIKIIDVKKSHTISLNIYNYDDFRYIKLPKCLLILYKWAYILSNKYHCDDLFKREYSEQSIIDSRFNNNFGLTNENETKSIIKCIYQMDVQRNKNKTSKIFPGYKYKYHIHNLSVDLSEYRYVSYMDLPYTKNFKNFRDISIIFGNKYSSNISVDILPMENLYIN